MKQQPLTTKPSSRIWIFASLLILLSLASAMAQKTGDAALVYDGKRYAIVAKPADFVAAALGGRYAALGFTFDQYIEKAKGLMDAATAAGASPGNVFSPSVCICQKCGNDLPSSYVMAALMGGGSNIVGSRSPAELQAFVTSNKCPVCGGTAYCFISIPTSAEGVTAADVRNIKTYFKYLATIWWGSNSGWKICDRCNASIAQGEGYIYGSIENGYLRASRLYCEDCMNSTVGDPELLANLQRNPNYMGAGLIDKVREYMASTR